MRFLIVPSALAALIVFAACGSGDEATTVTVRETVTVTGAATVPGEAPMVVTLYFLDGGKVAPEERGIITGPDVATNTIHQLFEGTESDLTSAIPEGVKLQSLIVDGDLATIRVEPRSLGREALAQIVYTLTQFETVKRVAVNDSAPVDRGDFEAQTPAILVESPLPGETVEPGFEVTGTANTFEATFNYELKDAKGKVLSKNFVTATSGSGTRGTFRFTVPYEGGGGEARLVVFETSAEDGSRMHESEIPLVLE